MRLELTPSEQAFLVDILEERYRELLLEVRHAHHHREFRTLLREKQAVLESIIDKVRVAELAVQTGGR
jgi:hypothetical protein